MVCVALCAGESLAASIIVKYFGISEAIFGVWIGALGLILTIITVNSLDKKNIKFFFRKPLIFILYAFLFIYPMYLMHAITNLHNFILGYIIGSLSLAIGYSINDYLIKKNNGKVYFKLQKSIIPIIFPILASLILYLLKL